MKIEEEESKCNVDISFNSNGYQTMITLKPFEIKKKLSSRISCVIDVSGSMGNEVTIKTDKGNKESVGFTTLDLVKHSLITTIESLEEEDELAIITFNSEAKVK